MLEKLWSRLLGRGRSDAARTAAAGAVAGRSPVVAVITADGGVLVDQRVAARVKRAPKALKAGAKARAIKPGAVKKKTSKPKPSTKRR